MDNFKIFGCSTQGADNNTAIVTTYKGDLVELKPFPSTITIVRSDTDNSYTISLNGNISVTITFLPDGSLNIEYLNDSGNFIAVSLNTLDTIPTQICCESIDPLFTFIQFDILVTQTIPSLFLKGDEYTINVSRRLDGTLIASVIIERTTRPGFENMFDPCLLTIGEKCPCLLVPTNTIQSSSVQMNTLPIQDQSCPKKVLVPIILIEGQTLTDGTDLSDMKFTIIDDVQYYSHECLVGTKCGMFFVKRKNLKQTIFRKCCEDTSLFKVLRGEGKNAFEKAKHLYLCDKEIQKQVDFYTFYYNNLILYSMSKYILSRLLYGKFSIKYLLQKYNEEFYINLGDSRFCGALRIFNDENQLASYDRFFK